ncbi:hypothetical protein AAMO2058_000407500 [Amorphochlora amoebiformis]
MNAPGSFNAMTNRLAHVFQAQTPHLLPSSASLQADRVGAVMSGELAVGCGEKVYLVGVGVPKDRGGREAIPDHGGARVTKPLALKSAKINSILDLGHKREIQSVHADISPGTTGYYRLACADTSGKASLALISCEEKKLNLSGDISGKKRKREGGGGG